jgi:hypothetical protein
MAIALTGIVGDLTSLIPSSGDLIQQVILGAGAGVVLAGLKSSAGLDAIDPLHIVPRPAVPATNTSPAIPASVSTIVGKTMPAAALAGLSADQITAVGKAGYSFV